MFLRTPIYIAETERQARDELKDGTMHIYRRADDQLGAALREEAIVGTPRAE